MAADDLPGAEPDYKATVFLPSPAFPMRAGLPQREPAWLARWEAMGLYRRLREQSKGRPGFELHDGPPYANGHLHIGHALNKILKDFVVRSRQMLGYDSAYVPGWDCHGLPIEWKIEEQYRAQGLDKDSVPINELRAECRRFAEGWIDIQRAEFKRLGVTGDWDHPYLTMSYDAEATIAAEFMAFVMNGSLYRGSKPVMWSVVEQTALAEAEVEYHEHQSTTIWVKFPVVDAPSSDLSDATVLIWTTTPWTIPQNRAICFNPHLVYGLYRVTAAPEDNWAKPGDMLLMADALAEGVFTQARVEAFEKRRAVSAKELAALTCAHPLRDLDPEFAFDVPMLAGDHVTDEAGTGFVHTAPAHGADDYNVAINAQDAFLDFRNKGRAEYLQHILPHNVLPDGAFREDLPLFGGARIFDAKGKEGDANRRVVEKLIEAGALLARGRLRHSYPHSWRSKAPLIFRNTPQWFIAIDKPLEDGLGAHGDTIRARALKSIEELVAFTPRTGRNRLHSMIAARPDWVVSRQRAWGVPLTCFRNRETGVLLRDPEVNARIVAAFRAEGADAWFADGAKARFLGNGYDPEDWDKVDDILDVWFDSGSTHAFALRDRGGRWPADVYLEGTDQHRGWFHSSLLQGCGTRGRAPYRAVVTHGFTLDEKGEKMSKSRGNVVAPEKVVAEYGADILRLWVATTDYTEDQRIGPKILKSVADGYRRLRNGFRFMLGALAEFDEAERVAPADMPELERWVLHRLAELDAEVRAGYEAFAYQKVYAALFTFVTADLSAFYFDIRKDALYCDAPDSVRRRACRTVMDLLFHRLTTWLAPILAFTMEEVWLERFPGDDSSVHLQVFPETPAAWRDAALAAKWAKVRAVRRVVLGALEIERREKRIGAALEAAPIVHVEDAETRAACASVDMADVCITSALTLSGDPAPDAAFRLPEAPGVAVEHVAADGAKCARCWKVLPDVGAHRHAAVCARCDAALDIIPSARGAGG
ncbi:MAG: isoleucine--tRNA ligase [Rhodobacteraceae bacterium]|nr:MAG: isoleucine--tRNA ligase [Paracoccaceae bacterium]